MTFLSAAPNSFVRLYFALKVMRRLGDFIDEIRAELTAAVEKMTARPN